LDYPLTTEANQFQFSSDEKSQYAVFNALFSGLAAGQNEVLSNSVLAFSESGNWSTLAAVHENDHSWTLHIVLQSPTLNILESIASKLSPLIADLAFHVHSCSDWLAGNIGLVVKLDPHAANQLSNGELIAQLVTAFHIDIALIHNAPKLTKPGLLIMDMDSTVIATECIDEIADLAGVGSEVAAVTESAMQGELDFAQSLIARVACLQGLEQTALETVKNKLPLMQGLTRLINQLNNNRWHIAIASGGFTYFAEYLQQRLGLDASIANVLSIEEGVLTGKVEGDIVDASAKAKSVETLSQRWQIPLVQTIAMGDGANDLQMMEKAHLGIAFKAKPIVQSKADAAIRFTGLDTALFYLR
jgi:phosphoserine phosphatase